MRKIFSLIAAVLFAGSMMADNFVLVTDASTLAAGDQIIITDVDAAVAISTLQKSNNRGVTNVALTDGVIVPGPNVQIITLVAAEANFMLQVGEDAYLYAASNSSNHLKTANAETVGDNGKFAISITEGVASVTAQGTNSRNDLRYNSSSSCFSCYGSTSSIEAGLKIFKKEGGVTPPEPTEEYYLTGSIRNWAQTADEDYKFVVNTAAQGEYMLQGITLAANDELKVIGIVGETLNWYPDGQGNNYVVAADGTYDIYFRPDGQGGEDWHQGYFYVAEVVPQTAMSLTEFIAAAPTTEVTLKDLIVIFAAGKNTYVVDEDGVALVIYDASQTYYDGTLTAGKVLSGQKATYTKYKNQDEIIPTNAVVATDGVAPVPTELNAKPTNANINRYISFKNVAAAANNGKYYIYEDVQLYGATSALKPTEEGNYDVEGIYILYNETVPEIIVTGLQASTETAIDNTNIDAKAVKFFENGQLIIIKNGVRYNAQGAVVR